jgi:hypothetical protein
VAAGQRPELDPGPVEANYFASPQCLTLPKLGPSAKQPVWRQVSSLFEQNALSQFSFFEPEQRETQVAYQPVHEPASATLKDPVAHDCAAAATVIAVRNVLVRRRDVIDFMAFYPPAEFPACCFCSPAIEAGIIAVKPPSRQRQQGKAGRFCQVQSA